MFQFNKMDAEGMLAHELETLRLELLESKVPNGGLETFSSKQLGPK